MEGHAAFYIFLVYHACNQNHVSFVIGFVLNELIFLTMCCKHLGTEQSSSCFEGQMLSLVLTYNESCCSQLLNLSGPP